MTSIIIAPSHSSLQSMLTLCDQYASRHHLISNPSKTKCMFLLINKNMDQFPVIFCNESLIEFVKECCLLEFKISTVLLNRNIDATTERIYRKCNEVRFEFSMLSCDTKSKFLFCILYETLLVTTMELWYRISRNVLCCVEKSNMFNMEITTSYTL